MSSAAEQYTLYQVANAPVRLYPFPHMLVRDVFQPELYARMLENLLPAELMHPIKAVRPIGSTYSDERFVMPLLPETVLKLPAKYAQFWEEFGRWLLAAPFANILMSRFGPALEERFGGSGPIEFFNESMLVEDRTRYSLGPHSDSPSKVITVLFYLPADESRRHLGTSIYVPKDPNFRCPGGPHHRYEKFHRIMTMPFIPNTMFTFVKNDVSFHGVEPIADQDCRRHLLFYDIRVNQGSKSAPAPKQAPTAAKPSTRFTF